MPIHLIIAINDFPLRIKGRVTDYTEGCNLIKKNYRSRI